LFNLLFIYLFIHTIRKKEFIKFIFAFINNKITAARFLNLKFIYININLNKFVSARLLIFPFSSIYYKQKIEGMSAEFPSPLSTNLPSKQQQQHYSLFNLSSSSTLKTNENTQPNSPSDSAIGTASDSTIQNSPPPNKQKQQPIPLPRIISPSLFSFSSSNNNNKEYNQVPPRPPKKSTITKNISNKRINGLSIPILDKIICEKDFEKIIKETEIFSSKPEISQKEIIENSKLSREYIQKEENEEDKEILLNNGGIIENKRYYLFDSIRHEYRLYYSKEVFLRKLLPKRRHSVGTSARIRRPIPPPYKIQTSINELINQQKIEGEQKKEEILLQPLISPKLGSFERNTNLRKANKISGGGSKRSAAAVVLKQQRLKNNNKENNKQKIENCYCSSSSSSPSLLLNNQIIKDLLKPLNSSQIETEIEFKINNEHSIYLDDKNNEKHLTFENFEKIKEENFEQSHQSFLSSQKSSKAQTNNFSRNRRKISERNNSKNWTRFQCFLGFLLDKKKSLKKFSQLFFTKSMEIKS
ncbi:hypothetical protein Mgra_00006912, partial [Meloidogyne graminicola]